MKQIFINQYTNWTKDITYSQSNREDLKTFIQKEVSEEDFNKLVKMWIEEVKRLIDDII